MDHTPAWLLVVLLVAPPAFLLLGVLAGGWLWHRATTGNRSPVPAVRPASSSASGLTKGRNEQEPAARPPLPRVQA